MMRRDASGEVFRCIARSSKIGWRMRLHRNVRLSGAACISISGCPAYRIKLNVGMRNGQIFLEMDVWLFDWPQPMRACSEFRHECWRDWIGGLILSLNTHDRSGGCRDRFSIDNSWQRTCTPVSLIAQDIATIAKGVDRQLTDNRYVLIWRKHRTGSGFAEFSRHPQPAISSNGEYEVKCFPLWTHLPCPPGPVPVPAESNQRTARGFQGQ